MIVPQYGRKSNHILAVAPFMLYATDDTGVCRRGERRRWGAGRGDTLARFG